MGLTTLLYSTTALAAERVVVSYGILQESISVAELTEFARTGEPSPALRSYLDMANADPKEVRQTLTKEIEVDPVTLDRVLNSALGNVVLDEMSTAIRTPANAANRQALRAALVLSASKDKKVSLLEAIQNYPTQEVHLDGNRIVNAYNQLDKVGRQLRGVLGQIEGLF